MGSVGVSHLGIGVTDLDRSTAFYRDVVGLQVVTELEYEDFPELLHFPDHRMRRYVYFATSEEPGAPVIVMGPTHPQDNSHPVMADQLGVHHVALWFDDLRPLIKRLEAEDVEIFWGPYYVKDYVTMYFRDPDGICIQAEQRTSGNEESYPELFPDGPPQPKDA